MDHIDYLFTDFQELHGDRDFGDDHALIGGTAFFEGKPVMVVAQRGRIGVADRILIFEYAYYSVITPESCAAILWRSKAYAAQAAEALRLHAQELLKYRVADEIVDEPFGGAHNDPEISAERLKLALSRHLKILCSIPSSDLIVQRCQKYRSIGEFEDLAAQAVAG